MLRVVLFSRATEVRQSTEDLDVVGVVYTALDLYRLVLVDQGYISLPLERVKSLIRLNRRGVVDSARGERCCNKRMHNRSRR